MDEKIIKTGGKILEIKEPNPDSQDAGIVRSEFARFNVIDLDGDVILPTAFTQGQKVMLVASHDWSVNAWHGFAEIEVTAEAAIANSQFNMLHAGARDAFQEVKMAHSAGLGEWSWGFHVPPGAQRIGQFMGREVRFLGDVPLEIREVSPVLVGAGIGTHTIDAKDGDKKMTLDAEAKAVLDDATSLKTRYGELVTMRAADGGRLPSDLSREALGAVLLEFQGIADEIKRLVDKADPEQRTAIESAFSHSLQLRAV